MKQANFSAMLSQPFEWSKLSKASKERFLTMHIWLNDPNRMEKLKNHSQFQLTTGKLIKSLNLKNLILR